MAQLLVVRRQDIVMSSKVINYVALSIGVLGVICLSASGPRWAGFLGLFLCLGLTLIVSLRDGEIFSNFGFGSFIYGSNFRRDEEPVFFAWGVIVQSLLTLGCLFAFLFSL